MVNIERTINSLKKISKEIEMMVEDLAGDGFEDYADNLQDTLDKISTLLFTLNNET